MNLRGVLTPISIFANQASIFRQVVGGQVPKERNNWKLNLQGGFGESRSKIRYRSPGRIPFREPSRFNFGFFTILQIVVFIIGLA